MAAHFFLFRHFIVYLASENLSHGYKANIVSSPRDNRFRKPKINSLLANLISVCFSILSGIIEMLWDALQRAAQQDRTGHQRDMNCQTAQAGVQIEASLSVTTACSLLTVVGTAASLANLQRHFLMRSRCKSEMTSSHCMFGSDANTCMYTYTLGSSYRD